MSQSTNPLVDTKSPEYQRAFNQGALMVLTELNLQGYTDEAIAQIMRPMNFDEEEILAILQDNGGEEWFKTPHLEHVYEAWQRAQLEEDEE